MKVVNLILSVLAVFVILVFIYLASQSKSESLLSLAGGSVWRQYYLAGINADRDFYALGVSPDEKNILVSAHGNKDVVKKDLTEYGIPEEFKPEDMHVSIGGDLFIGGRNVFEDTLYLIKSDEDTAIILKSVYSSKNYSNVFTHIFEDDSGCSFMIYEDGGIRVYIFDNHTQSIIQGDFYNDVETAPLAVYPDGTRVILSGKGEPQADVSFITVSLESAEDILNNSEEEAEVPFGMDLRSRAEVWANTNGVWVLDRVTSKLWNTSIRSSSGVIENLEESQIGSIVGITVSNAGAVTISDTGSVILKKNPVNMERLDSYLNSRKTLAIVMICVISLLSLLAILTIYNLLELNCRKKHSIVVRGTVVCVSLITSFIILAYFFFIRQTSLVDTADWMLDKLTYECMEESQYDEMKANAVIDQEGEYKSELMSFFQDALNVVHFKAVGDRLYVEDEDGSLSNIAVLRSPTDYNEAVYQAFREGQASTGYIYNGRDYLMSALKTPYGVVAVSSNDDPLDLVDYITRKDNFTLLFICLISCFVATAGMFGILCRKMANLTKACDDFMEGRIVSIPIETADEIGDLAGRVEHVVSQNKETLKECSEYKARYKSFMPDGMLSLMGVDSVEKLTPGYSVEGEKIIMTVGISYSDELKHNHSEETYRSLNQALVRLKEHIVGGGGTVVGYQSYFIRAVFPEDSVNALKSAVAMRLDLDAISEAHGLSRGDMGLLICLDRVPIRIGVCGDDNGLSVITTQSSMMDISGLYDSFLGIGDFIVCSEEVIKVSEESVNRYIGSFKDGDRDIELYEVYEGDPYEVRLAKTYSLEVFEHGVSALREGNFTDARKCLLKVVHDNVKDMTAMYYLKKTDALIERYGGDNTEE